MGIKERKKRERERRRQQIMLAAKRVFSEKGFNRATMEDIAREAELSPGTLYLYFKDKEELYASLSLRILKYINTRLEEVNRGEEDAKQRLLRLIDAMDDVYDFDPLIIINMFHLQSSDRLRRLSPALKTEIETLSRQALKTTADIFRDGIGKGRYLDRHPVALADIFWSLFSGLVLWEASKRIMDDKKDFLKPTLSLAFELFQRGIERGTTD